MKSNLSLFAAFCATASLFSASTFVFSSTPVGANYLPRTGPSEQPLPEPYPVISGRPVPQPIVSGHPAPYDSRTAFEIFSNDYLNRSRVPYHSTVGDYECYYVQSSPDVCPTSAAQGTLLACDDRGHSVVYIRMALVQLQHNAQSKPTCTPVRDTYNIRSYSYASGHQGEYFNKVAFVTGDMSHTQRDVLPDTSGCGTFTTDYLHNEVVEKYLKRAHNNKSIHQLIESFFDKKYESPKPFREYKPCK